jgi:dynein heavy chain
VLEAVCILKGIKPVRFKDPQSGQMVDSYWEASKKMLMDEEFLLSLRWGGGDKKNPYAMYDVLMHMPSSLLQ